MMLEQWSPRTDSIDVAVRGRRTLDRAEGVLMGLCGCSSEEAFMELVTAAHDTGHRLSSVTSALLDLIADDQRTGGAHDVARDRWGHLLSAGRGSAGATRVALSDDPSR